MSVADQPPIPTEHALLVPFGRFARQIGLLEALHRVPIKMKTIDHRPGDKLAELLIHILAGGMHVKELETSPHPLVHDRAVAHAWGQESFASASGVSELLGAVSPQSVAALKVELVVLPLGNSRIHHHVRWSVITQEGKEFLSGRRKCHRRFVAEALVRDQ